MMLPDEQLPAGQRPAALGYRWPAEWEPHSATWLSWPHNRETWPGTFDQIPSVYAQLVRTIAEYEDVHVLAGGDEVMSSAAAFVGDLDNVTLHDIETNDAWARDHGPTFLAGSPDGQPALIDWQYNAWGGKYPPFDKDNAVPAQIASLVQRHRFTPQLVLEGGAIDGNGQGLILTTESCLLNVNRNPRASRESVDQLLQDYLGARKVLWLTRGEMVGDDTDGHIDQLARFVDENTIVTAYEENRDDENHAALTANLEQLQRMTDLSGQPLQIIPIQMPRPLFHQEHRLPASYMNFYIINGAVIVPQYNDEADERACATLAQLFPQRDIRGLPAAELVWGLGAFHCLTQQEPVLSAS